MQAVSGAEAEAENSYKDPHGVGIRGRVPERMHNEDQAE